ncbi:hypothetical protein KKE47_04130 [Patescibacteria group bacterium]|nr:hypothetical protein [Patescibacteria group bacterium]MCG2701821.1 hypothetical protein [Candidatus Parcubacteria bacterium]
MGIFVLIGFTGYTFYNKQEEEKNKLLQEVSSLKSEVKNLNSKLNSKTEELETVTNNLSKQDEEFSHILGVQNKQIVEHNTQADKEEVCRQANDLFLKIKQACDVKPFPGTDECIEELESKLEYLGEENYKKYHMDEKVDNLKELRSRYLTLKNQCGE